MSQEDRDKYEFSWFTKAGEPICLEIAIVEKDEDKEQCLT